VIVYLDASVILRLVLGQPDQLPEWREVERGVTSALTEVECLRALDRFRIAASASESELARRRELVYRLLEEAEEVDVTGAVLRRAAQPFPTALRTLDAIHLATALLWRDARGEDLVLATHDKRLALAARACGLQVVGAIS
jgi:predicted nucleic acid-binding protein